MGKMNPTMIDLTTKPVKGACPKCGACVEFDESPILRGIVPLCDDCGDEQERTWKEKQREQSWRRYFRMRLPDGYHGARRDEVPLFFHTIFQWTSVDNKGGIGLIGKSGVGKSHAIASLLRKLERPFLWWSGTEARDAAIDAATADKDREGCKRRWEQGMTIPILVLDDISQGRMTEAWSSKLFDLLETRMSGNLPTFWTSQIDLPALRQKIVRQNGGDDAQSQAISRRLSQHSMILRA